MLKQGCLVIALMLCIVPAHGLEITRHNDWVCFVDPFDLNPENRINILGSIDLIGILHVERDGKKLKGQRKLNLSSVTNADNVRVFSFSDGSTFSVVLDTSYGFNQDQSGRKLEIIDGWHPGIYLKGRGGIMYKCKPVELER